MSVARNAAASLTYFDTAKALNAGVTDLAMPERKLSCWLRWPLRAPLSNVITAAAARDDQETVTFLRRAQIVADVAAVLSPSLSGPRARRKAAPLKVCA